MWLRLEKVASLVPLAVIVSLSEAVVVVVSAAPAHESQKTEIASPGCDRWLPVPIIRAVLGNIPSLHQGHRLGRQGCDHLACR